MKLFSGDEDGVVICTEIDYTTVSLTIIYVVTHYRGNGAIVVPITAGFATGKFPISLSTMYPNDCPASMCTSELCKEGTVKLQLYIKLSQLNTET